MKQISFFIDQVSEWLGKITAWFTLLMVVLMTSVVVMRYGLNIGSIALQESVSYFHAAALLFAAGYTLKYDEHVRVDVFYRHFSLKKKAMVNLLGHLCLLLPVVIFIFCMSVEYVANAWQIKEASAEPGGLPLVYVLKSFILVFSVVMVLQAVSEIIKSILLLTQSQSQSQTQSQTQSQSPSQSQQQSHKESI
ncbi:hypothetical protein C2869_17030 [Saccharobesus litoralis]|uniref:TRAP transporter small permease protein n=1 Tax=Saccharobesus litoralis TaxID=2172099 RepID=A0A2S0VUX7_9ALTE|nr:TRAP transporter small permease subunit [Saccharobesus litoralis]AWB68024.1 hypothetical protein C2869_17030 [Saccharobesus litoralis]